MVGKRKYDKLAGKKVLIIGGTSGIGYCVAEASIEAGAIVTISSSLQSKVEGKVQKLKEDYPESSVSGYVCDLATPDVEANIEKLFNQVGAVDHIVFTAGNARKLVPLNSISVESIQETGFVRFVGPLLVAKVGSRYLSPGPISSITLTTGASSEKPVPTWSVVSSYTAAIHGMVRNLALDLKPIRVNAVSPGVLDTEMWSYLPAEARKARMEGAGAKLLTGRVGNPEDVANAYIWLMKDSNATGTIAATDGGTRMV